MGKKITKERQYYINKYNVEHYKNFNLRIKENSEKEILDFLDTVDDVNEFVIGLIRREMNTQVDAK